MARYRQTSNEKSRVGRDIEPSPTPTPSPGASKKNSLDARINSMVGATSLAPYLDAVQQVDVTVEDFLDQLNSTQLKAIGELLRKGRYSVKNIEDVKAILSDADTYRLRFEDADLRNVGTFVAALNNQLIPKADAGGPKESVSVTQYGPEQVDSWVDNWLTKEAGRTLESLSPDVAKTLRKAVKDYATGQSVTTVTRDKQGRPVTTYKPAMSEAGIAQTLEDVAGTTELYKDVERRKAFEFGDILNKTLGIGQI